MDHSHNGLKPRILLLGSQMTTGGAQRVLLDQADWLHQHGYPVEVAFLYDRDGLQERWQTGRDFPILNLRFRSLQAGGLQNALSFMGGLFRLFRLMRRRKYQVIETFTHHSNLIGCLLGWAAGIPVRIASHHGSIERMPVWVNRLHSWIVNWGFADKLVVVSLDVLRQSKEEGINPKRLVIIPNGVPDVDRNSQNAAKIREEILSDHSGVLILSIGRLTYQKAHTYLLKAFSTVLKQHPNSLTALAGEGPLLGDLETEANELGIRNKVRFLGVRSDIPDLLTASDFFVLSSRWEGMPLVLLEAMRAGIPIAATDVHGIREALDDGKCGLIVPTEDPAALADAMLRLIHEPELAKQLGQAARRRFEQHYTLQKMMEGYMALLDPSSAGQVEGGIRKIA